MSSDRQPPLSLVRHLVVGNLDKPLFELIDGTLACLVRGLDARAAFYGKIHDNTLEILAAEVESGPAIAPGLRLPLDATFMAAEVSILRMRAWGIGLASVLQNAMRSARKSSAYLARPVTFATTSTGVKSFPISL